MHATELLDNSVACFATQIIARYIITSAFKSILLSVQLFYDEDFLVIHCKEFIGYSRSKVWVTSEDLSIANFNISLRGL